MKNKSIEEKILTLLSMTYAIPTEDMEKCLAEVKSFDQLFQLVEFSSDNNISLERARGMI
jgi:hypothetical protein